MGINSTKVIIVCLGSASNSKAQVYHEVEADEPYDFPRPTPHYSTLQVLVYALTSP